MGGSKFHRTNWAPLPNPVSAPKSRIRFPGPTPANQGSVPSADSIHEALSIVQGSGFSDSLVPVVGSAPGVQLSHPQQNLSGLPSVCPASGPTLAVPKWSRVLFSDTALPDSQPWQRPQLLGSDSWSCLLCVQRAQKCSLPAWEPGDRGGWVATSLSGAEEEELVHLLTLCMLFVPRQVQQLQQVPVPHVYSSQVQYVEGGDASYTTSAM